MSGRAWLAKIAEADNVKIERWFRSFKQKESYLTEWHII